MSITPFPNGVSSFGMPLVGFTTGSVFFVHSTTGSNGNSGTDPDHPFASIDYAVGNCTANKGDVIFAMPGHADTVVAAGGLTLDIAGITIIGLGNGTLQPSITLGTGTLADIEVDAANVKLQNLLIDMTAIDAIVAAIDVDAANFEMHDCEIRLADTAGAVLIGVTLDGNADHCVFNRCQFMVYGGSGPNAAIHASGSEIEGLTITNCYFGGEGDVETYINATIAGSGWLIADNYFEVDLDGKLPFNFGLTDADNSGIIARNMVVCSSATLSALSPVATAGTGNLGCFENYAVEKGSDAPAILFPETAAYPA